MDHIADLPTDVMEKASIDSRTPAPRVDLPEAAAESATSEAEPHGERLRILTVAGAGHFPHEEAPAEVIRLLLGSTAMATERGGAR